MTQVSLAELIGQVRCGEALISFPTDTVLALAARPDRAERIFTAKQRDPSKPLILMGATPESLWPFVSGTPAEWRVWQQVAEQFWPGALTLVLPASDRVPSAVNPTNTATIGLRVPDHGLAQAILSRAGPLATTSVNRSGQPPLQTLSELEAQFPEVLTLHPSEVTNLNLPPLSASLQVVSGIPSTVARWTGAGWEILRQGTVQIPS